MYPAHRLMRLVGWVAGWLGGWVAGTCHDARQLAVSYPRSPVAEESAHVSCRRSRGVLRTTVGLRGTGIPLG